MSELDSVSAYNLDAQDPLANYRDRFVNKDPELIYLDGNSLGRLPRATIGRLQDVIEKEWGDRLIRGWNEGWFRLQESVGGKIAKLIGAEPDEVVVADSTSVNLFKLTLAAIRAQTGRHKIITDDLNFPSDLYVLQSTADLQSGSYIERISSEDDIHGPTEQISNALNDGTALLTLSHVTFKSGFIYNMALLSQQAREVGALTLWDLSHSAGSIEVNLRGSGADLAVGCTYKYLNGGPGAPAFLYVRRELQERLGNPLAGWFGQKNMFALDLDYQPESGIRRFLTGTPTILSLAAVENGVDLLNEVGIANLRKKSVAQTEYLIHLHDRYLAPLGFKVNSPRSPQMRGSHVSIGHPEGWRINQALIEEKKVLPDFREPDNLRLGIAPIYTTYADLYTAVMRIRSVVQDELYLKYDEARSEVT
ncbi:MAG: kynureninase [Ardenticatenaceae bacterium]|nr:kynureninase [Ardenticatenaceae bacterium]